MSLSESGLRFLVFVALFLSPMISSAQAPASAPAAPLFNLARSGQLPRKTQMHGTVVLGNRLYIIAGTYGTPSTKVDSAEILGNGKLGPWRRETDLPNARLYVGTCCEAIHNRIYVIGGNCSEPSKGCNMQMDALWTEVNPDGTIKGWQRSAPLPGPYLTSTATCSSDQFLFVTGGNSATEAVSSDIIVGDVRPDGAPGNWRLSGKLPMPLWFHGAAMIEERMYIWGGLPTPDNKIVNARVFSTQVSLKGTIDKWEEESPWPSPMYSSAFCGFNDCLVAVAGRYVNGYPANHIWYANIRDKHVQGWQMLQTDLESRVFHSLGLDKTRGMVYVTGGQPRTTPGISSAVYLLDNVQMFGLPKRAEVRLDLNTAQPAASQTANGTLSAPFTSIIAALSAASSSGKPVLVFIYSPEVPASRRSWDNVISKPEFASMISRYQFTVLDASTSKTDLSYQYGIYKVPALLILNQDGSVKSKTSRFSDLAEVRSFLQAQ